MTSLSESVGQDVPTFDEVRDKIEARYAKAKGMAELQGHRREPHARDRAGRRQHRGPGPARPDAGRARHAVGPTGRRRAGPKRRVVIFRQYELACLRCSRTSSPTSAPAGPSSSTRSATWPNTSPTPTTLGLTIERVIETHVHADFLTGHLELAARTGAVISYGDAIADAREFPIEPLADGRAARRSATSSSRSARRRGTRPSRSASWSGEHAGDAGPYGVLTGDTLFIGDVGRPDLLVAAGAHADELGRQLYHSLHEHCCSRLPDSTRVYPAHGAGSACGKNHVDGHLEHHRRAAPHQLRPRPDGRGRFVGSSPRANRSAPPTSPFDASRTGGAGRCSTRSIRRAARRSTTS